MLLAADFCCVLSGTTAEYGSGNKSETENSGRFNDLAAFPKEGLGCLAVP